MWSFSRSLWNCLPHLSLALFAALAAGGCKPQGQLTSVPPPPVTVATPIRKEVVEWDEYTGRTQAVESVEIRPRVSGYVSLLSFYLRHTKRPSRESARFPNRDGLRVLIYSPQAGFRKLSLIKGLQVTVSAAHKTRSVQKADIAPENAIDNDVARVHLGVRIHAKF